jgi:uncharacterized OsmC-like protein
MMQYTSLVIGQGLPIEDVKMMARGHTTRELPRAFTDMVFEVRLEGTPSQEQVETLARDASAHCFVENTLGKAIPVTTIVFLNGTKVFSFTRSPVAVAGSPDSG